MKKSPARTKFRYLRERWPTASTSEGANREDRTGCKVIPARMKDGKPTGAYEDVMTGFVWDKDTAGGRPAGIVVARDAALLVSDDANGTIFPDYARRDQIGRSAASALS